MRRGLYYQDVQRLAEEHDLPVSRTKDELIEELIEYGGLTAAEVVAFLRVDQLRLFLQEVGLPSGASRDDLAERLATFLSPPRPARPRRRQASTTRDNGPALKRPILVGNATVPEPIGQQPFGTLPEAQRTGPSLFLVRLPEVRHPSVAWGFAGLLFAVVFAPSLYISVQYFGVITGAILSAVIGVAVALGLLLTARRWVPWIDGLAG